MDPVTLALGGAALIALIFGSGGCDDGGGEIPPLPEREDGGDVGEEEGVDDAPEADEGAEEADAADADAYDADADTVPDGIDADAADDDAVDADGDTTIDGGDADGDVTPPENYYSCAVTVMDLYGMSYVASVVSSGPVSYTGGNWSGRMWFDGSPADLVNARRNDAAYTWPQSGQTIPLYAQNLTATYGAQFIIESGGRATFSLASYPAGGVTPTGQTILPMTWAADDGSAEPIAADTANEIYVAADPLLEIQVSSPDGYETFAGEAMFVDTNWTITDPPDYLSSVGVQCERL